jgi:Fungal chitosanase of glycosyl hydrolase group 75
VPNRKLDVGKIFNGMEIRETLVTEQGTTATRDRNELSSYTAEVTVKVKVPKPHHDLEEIKLLNNELPNVLPGLPALLESSKVSPSFDELYRLKCASLESSFRRLDAMLSRHNFYDCETLLELQNPKTKRRALLIQADMDTDTDGSDSDRMPEIDGASVTFQPFTSYRWAKRGNKPNSFVAPREVKIKQYENELSMGGASASRKEDLRAGIARLRTEISDLKKYSFLIACNDPYVVLPSSMFSRSRNGAYTPSVGDYCVVIYGRALFPAIIGDVGPSNVIGEASLRICQQIDARADADNRPVNDLKVTYLVFPGTAEKFDVPDFDKWGARCEKLLEEIGGHKGDLVKWADPTKPKPPPATPPPATPAPVTPAPGAPAPSTPSSNSSPAPASPKPATATPSPAKPAATSPKPTTPGPASTPQATPAASATPAVPATPKKPT